MIIEAHVPARPGLYVANFSGAMKLGRSANLAMRTAQHFADGANRIWVSPPVRNVAAAEFHALYAAGLHGVRRGRTETFDQLSFDSAIEAVMEGIERSDCARPAAEIDLDALRVKRIRTHRVGPWLTRDETARRLRVSAPTIDRYARHGKLPRYFSPGGQARYRVEDIDALTTTREER
jgi:excisionase family DNA binding protein